MNWLMFAVLVVLLYIAWEVRLFRRVLGAIVVEMQSTRWERGVRDGLARDALEKLGMTMADAERLGERLAEMRSES